MGAMSGTRKATAAMPAPFTKVPSPVSAMPGVPTDKLRMVTRRARTRSGRCRWRRVRQERVDLGDASLDVLGGAGDPEVDVCQRGVGAALGRHVDPACKRLTHQGGIGREVGNARGNGAVEGEGGRKRAVDARGGSGAGRIERDGGVAPVSRVAVPVTVAGPERPGRKGATSARRMSRSALPPSG